jgi:predicted DNA-binding transcriptional regulator AlpA
MSIPRVATKHIDDPFDMYSKKQIARLLGVNPFSIDRWRKSDPEFPKPLWVSPSTPRWRRADIERWISSRQQGGIAPDWTKNHTKPRKESRKSRTGRR